MSINQHKEFNGVAIVMDKKEARVSHFEIARVLDIQAKSMMQLITPTMRPILTNWEYCVLKTLNL